MLFDAHWRLPLYLQVWAVMLVTFVLAFIGGAFFTLPPGPLCDEGMVLFMEGGCDFGRSNIFFFCKLALLVSLNLVFALAWRAGIRDVRGFAPHFLVLLGAALAFLFDPDCDAYYSHPNGSLGQMIFESMAFAALGCAMLAAFTRRTYPRLLAAIVIWNALHVALFYAGLLFTNHWTWTHTLFIVAGFGALSLPVVFYARRV